MGNGDKSPLVTQTAQDKKTATDDKVEATRTVTYIVNTAASASTLSLPYAVAVDGVVQPAFKDKSKRVSGANGEIKVTVKPGATVTLFLNSDASPSYRKEAVYAVTVKDRNVQVTIKEKMGKSSEADTPVLSSTDEKKNLEKYNAPLTGDIWKKVSHKFTEEEVDTLLPEGTSQEIKTAVKSIYKGLSTASLTMNVPASEGKAAATVTLSFADSDNPKDNIVSYSLLTDGLTRVHPAGYAALLQAAAKAGVTKLSMSSAWRPLLGSIAHRAGLGLDVSYIDSTRMNRQELRNAKAVDTTNVSDKEKELLTKFEAAKGQEAKANKAAKDAQANYNKVKKDPVQGPVAEKAAADAKKAAEEAKASRVEAEKAWNEERDKNEPAAVKAFRAALLTNSSVAQVFDPWFMDENTSDATAAQPNLQDTGNEALHAHHLHITVRDSVIIH